MLNEQAWEKETSPFHSGEQELQNRAGMREMQEQVGRRILRPFMPEQHRDFFSQLPFIIAGSVDDQGWPWASMLVGNPGFVSSPHDRALSLRGGSIQGDPFFENVQAEKPVGFVGIELPTRRRNRVNGVVAKSSTAIDINVVQSFGNCPQYIHTRDLEQVRDPQIDFNPKIERFTDLDERLSAFIAKADTFFVTSHNSKDDITDTGGIDVSHRGGKAGFVKVDGNTLTIPDYIGNFAFNTLGNFLVNPRAGLLFIDFTTGDIVQLTGTVDLLWEGSTELDAFRGAERGWRFHLDHGHILKAASPFRWTLTQQSPNTELTGDWEETMGILSAEENRNSWMPFEVSKIVDESSEIRSFYLKPASNSTLMPFKPGQFLSLRITPPGSKDALIRNYTVSSAPSDKFLRISVKREGVVSNHLHDSLAVGALIDVRAPNGGFWMDTDQKRPAVLLAGGVGITPMVSMARQAATDQFARRYHRPITLIHASNTTAKRSFAGELTKLQENSGGALRYLSVISQPLADETAGLNYHVAGHISPELLQQVLPIDDYDFYLCGPASFMQAMYDMLIMLGVEDSKIFAEAFGTSSLIRKESSNQLEENADIAEEAIIEFETSKVEQAWTKDQGTLLEFSEAHGIEAPAGCRSGNCGSCLTKINSGKVSYVSKTTFPTKENEVLICCAVPAKSDETLSLEL